MPEVVLILQLFLQSGSQVRSEVEMASLEECWDAAKQAIQMKEHLGQKLEAVAAGCYVTVVDEPT